MSETGAGDRQDGRISRRDALKRAAVVGGALWVAPAVQTVNMSKAFALAGSPRQVCYSVKVDEVGCDDGRFFCITPTGVAGGCSHDPIVDRTAVDGTWTVVLPTGCEFVEGASKCGHGMCMPATGSGEIATFHPCRAGGGKSKDISHIEFTFCCTEQQER